METPVHDNHKNINPVIQAQLKSNVGAIRELKYNSTGDAFAVIGQSYNSAEVWDAKTQTLTCTLIGHKEPITCIDWHPSGMQNWILTGSIDGTIKLWSAVTGKCQKTFHGPCMRGTKYKKCPISALAFAHNHHSMFIAGNELGEFCIRALPTQDYEQLKHNECCGSDKSGEAIYHVSLHKSGTLAFVATTQGLVYLFDLVTAAGDPYPWKQIGICGLEENEQVESVIINHQNQILLRIKKTDTQEYKYISVTIENEQIFESDLPMLDYCEKTDKYLSSLESKLFEIYFEPGAEAISSEDHLFTADSKINKALYNRDGNQIIVSTANTVTVLENTNNKWLQIYHTTSTSQLIFNPTNNDLFISIPTLKGQDENNSITLFEIQKLNTDTMDTGDYETTEEYISDEESDLENPDMDTQEELTHLTADISSHREEKIRLNKEKQTILTMCELVLADPDILHKSLIEVAASHPCEVVEKFITYKGTQILNEQDHEGKTALYGAVDLNKESIVKLLTERGASVNIADNQGLAPLHVAIKRSYLPIAGYLIAHQALLNQRTVTGETPLHIAINNRDLDAIQFLLDQDADLTILDSNLQTPLSLVIETKDLSLLKIFCEKFIKDNAF